MKMVLAPRDGITHEKTTPKVTSASDYSVPPSVLAFTTPNSIYSVTEEQRRQSNHSKKVIYSNVNTVTFTSFFVTNITAKSSTSLTSVVDDNYEDYDEETDNDDNDNVAKELFTEASTMSEVISNHGLQLDNQTENVSTTATSEHCKQIGSNFTFLFTTTINLDGNRDVDNKSILGEISNVTKNVYDINCSLSYSSNKMVNAAVTNLIFTTALPLIDSSSVKKSSIRRKHTKASAAYNKFRHNSFSDDMNDTFSRMDEINKLWYHYTDGRIVSYSYSTVMSNHSIKNGTKNLFLRLKEKSHQLIKKINEKLVSQKLRFPKIKIFTAGCKSTLTPKMNSTSNSLRHEITKLTTKFYPHSNFISTPKQIFHTKKSVNQKKRWENIKVKVFFIAVDENRKKKTTMCNSRPHKTITRKAAIPDECKCTQSVTNSCNENNCTLRNDTRIENRIIATISSFSSSIVSIINTTNSSITNNANYSCKLMPTTTTLIGYNTSTIGFDKFDNTIKSSYDNNYAYNMTNVNNTNNPNNGTVLNAAGRFMTNCLGQMSRVMHCFSASEPPTATKDNVTFYLFTRNNKETGEVLVVDDLKYDELLPAPEAKDNNNEDVDGDDVHNYEYYSEGDVQDHQPFRGPILWRRNKRNGTAKPPNSLADGHFKKLNRIEKRFNHFWCDKKIIREDQTDNDPDKVDHGTGFCDYYHEDNYEDRGKAVLFRPFNYKRNKYIDKKKTNFNKSCNINEDFGNFQDNDIDDFTNKFKGFKFGKSIIKSKYFNMKDETKVIVHGYTQSYSTEPIVQLKDAYLTKGSYNIILVDWSELSKGPCYNLASRYAKSVGALVKELIYQLAVGGISMKSVHLIGFSLGAQVSGFAGNDFNTGHIYRITGLDPALPFFPKKDPENILDAGDAHFVDIIHTSHILGQGLPLGHADFYPNGGVTQPGCDKSDVICSHARGLLLFIESVKSGASFPSYNCDSWEMFLSGKCNHTTVAYMGEACPANASGLFYLRTASAPPFAAI